MIDKETIGNKIKLARKKAGLSQVILAERIEIGRSSLAQYETGLYEPSIAVLGSIADATNVDVSIFFDANKEIVSKSESNKISKKTNEFLENYMSLYDDEKNMYYHEIKAKAMRKKKESDE